MKRLMAMMLCIALVFPAYGFDFTEEASWDEVTEGQEGLYELASEDLWDSEELSPLETESPLEADALTEGEDGLLAAEEMDFLEVAEEEFVVESELVAAEDDLFVSSASMVPSCGKNLTWKLAYGVVTIEGTGEMDDFLTVGPWGTEGVEQVYIGNGVTSIGNNAFNGCEDLRIVSVPVGIERIGDYAFRGCKKLVDVVTVRAQSTQEPAVTPTPGPEPTQVPVTPSPVPAVQPTLTLVTDRALLYVGASSTYSKLALGYLTDSASIVKFNSSNADVATVSKNGVVKAVGEGSATITAYLSSDKSVKAKCKVTVEKPTLSLSSSSLTVKKGQKATIAVSTVPAGKVKYTSSDKTIASVSKAGVVKGKKKGSCKITVSCNGIKKTVKVKVK